MQSTEKNLPAFKSKLNVEKLLKNVVQLEKEYTDYRDNYDRKLTEIRNKALVAAEKLEKRRRFNLRSLNLDRFEEELKVIWEIYNSAWEKNWGFVPMNFKEFKFAAEEVKSFINPEVCLIAEVKGEPAGFSLALPDVNEVLKSLNGNLFPFGWAKFIWKKNKIASYRVLTLGVKKKYRRLGIDAYMYFDLYRKFLKKKVKLCEMSWMLEDNTDILTPLFKIGGTIYKRHRIYEQTFKSQR